MGRFSRPWKVYSGDSDMTIVLPLDRWKDTFKLSTKRIEFLDLIDHFFC
jgi:hypothetical protein